jgi:hypothetical protein
MEQTIMDDSPHPAKIPVFVVENGKLIDVDLTDWTEPSECSVLPKIDHQVRASDKQPRP